MHCGMCQTANVNVKSHWTHRGSLTGASVPYLSLRPLHYNRASNKSRVVNNVPGRRTWKSELLPALVPGWAADKRAGAWERGECSSLLLGILEHLERYRKMAIDFSVGLLPQHYSNGKNTLFMKQFTRPNLSHLLPFCLSPLLSSSHFHPSKLLFGPFLRFFRLSFSITFLITFLYK